MDIKTTFSSCIQNVESPSYVVSEILLRDNLEVLNKIQKRSGAQVLLALKGFAMHSLFPLIDQYLSGACASGLWEAQLGVAGLTGEIHTYSPGFKQDDFLACAQISDHLCVNSLSQWDSLVLKMKEESLLTDCSFGIRINPALSQMEVRLYDPCQPESRLGVDMVDLLNQFDDDPSKFKSLEGIHFHALCEQNSFHLENLLKVVGSQLERILRHVKWVNFGGGHHITHSDYDLEHLIELIQDFSQRFNVDVILEPGEAVAFHTGILVSEVVDIIPGREDSKVHNVILDISCANHMPDVLEMPYRPQVMGGDDVHKYPFKYRLGGNTCLAGDVIGEYSFESELRVGSRIVFEDMAHYSMVKSTMFNGVKHPSIYILNEQEELLLTKSFGLSDFKNRLS